MKPNGGGRRHPALSAREAVRLAGTLGWTVIPRRRTGDLKFTAPGGESFFCPVPGRKSATSRRLSLALARAKEEQESAVTRPGKVA